MDQIVIQYRIEGLGSSRDLDKGIATENLMNECLGWSGLGRCDGHDIGTGTLNIFCDVIDAMVAEDIVIHCLQQNSQLDGAVIARRRRTGDDVYFVVWPKNFASEFEL